MGLFETKKVETNHGAPAAQGALTTASRPAGATQRFGIDRAIQLMRSLPADQNSALVAKVIANTLTRSR